MATAALVGGQTLSQVVKDGYSGPLIQDVREALYVLNGSGSSQPEEEVAIDIETSGLNPFSDKIAVVTLQGERSAVPIVLHTRGSLGHDLQRYLKAPGKRWTGHNLTGFDALFLEHNGVPVHEHRVYDTLTCECAVIQTGRRDVRVSLEAATHRRLGKSTKRKREDHSIWMNQALDEESIRYCAGDILQLHPLRHEQEARAREKGTEEALVNEMLLAPTVIRMSSNGLPFDFDEFYSYQAEQRRVVEERQGQLSSVFGRTINLNSPKQVSTALGEVGVEIDSTAAEVLQSVVDLEGPGAQVCQWLLDHRHANQRIKMYNDAWLGKYIANGRLHSKFWSCSTDTGRFSSSGPNMQQIPVDGRRIIGGTPGWKIVAADYSAIEVRVAAHLANDPALIAGFTSGEDMHRYVGGLVFGKAPGDITKEERQLAKAMQFCLLFGGGPTGFARYAKMSGAPITIEQSRHLVGLFMGRFTGIASMRNKAFAMQSRGGPLVLRLPSGLRRVLVGRECIATRILNTTVQGTAAAGVKFAMMECAKRGLDRYLGSTVHDELVASVPAGEAEEYSRELSAAMVAGMQRVISVPIKVDTYIGDNWGK